MNGIVPLKVPIKRGDVYWIDLSMYQSKGSEQVGVRPALVIQNNFANNLTDTVIVALISTFKRRKGKRIPTHVLINNVLPVLSVIMLEQLYYVKKDVLVAKVGNLNEYQMLKVDDRLRNSLGLSIAFQS